MRLTNRWNRFVYRLWAPVYDGTVNKLFKPGRKRAMDMLALQPGETALLVGIGTGADLPLLPEGVRVVGVDLSREMLAKAKSKLPLPYCEAVLVRGDGQNSLTADETFEAVILNLILSVIPNARACLQTAVRALRPGRRMVIFDKFFPDDRKPSTIRRMVNLFSTLFGTDINRRLRDILTGSGMVIVQEEASLFRGMYRVILLKREV